MVSSSIRACPWLGPHPFCDYAYCPCCNRARCQLFHAVCQRVSMSHFDLAPLWHQSERVFAQWCFYTRDGLFLASYRCHEHPIISPQRILDSFLHRPQGITWPRRDHNPPPSTHSEVVPSMNPTKISFSITIPSMHMPEKTHSTRINEAQCEKL